MDSEVTSRRRVAMVAFFLLAFGAPWIGWSYVPDSEVSFLILPAFCSLAGFVAAYVEDGREGLIAFLKRTTRVLGAVRLTVAAVFVPITLGVFYVIYRVYPLPALQVEASGALIMTLIMALWTGPLAEEFGWRGYLQPALGRRFSPLITAMAIAFVWCIWHLPVFYSSVFSTIESAVGFFSFCLTWSVFSVYFVIRAGGSVWPAVALHWAANVHASLIGNVWPSIDGADMPGGQGTTVWYLLVAMVFVLANWKFFITRQNGST